MRRLMVLLVIFFTLLSTSFVVAQTIDQKETVVLPKNKTVNENYFAAGESVTLSGTVNGDAYIAGGNLFVDGTVNGDLLIAGGAVNIDGTVTGDVRVAGGQIQISGDIGRNITVAGGSVTIAKDAKVGKGLVAGAGQLSIYAPLGSGAMIGAGNVIVGDAVNGNIMAGVGKMTLTSSASVQGNLKYYSDDQAQIQPGATVSGMIDYQRYPVEKEQVEKKVRDVESFFRNAGFVYKLYSALVAFILGAILITLFPRVIKTSIEIIEKQPWTSMGVGLLVLIIAPFILVLLAVTIVGIPIALILAIIYTIDIYLSKIPVAFFIGKKLADWFRWKWSPLALFLVGLIAWVLVTSIPYIGWFVQLLVVIVGIGSILLTRKHYLATFKSKNLL